MAHDRPPQSAKAQENVNFCLGLTKIRCLSNHHPPSTTAKCRKKVTHLHCKIPSQGAYETSQPQGPMAG